MKHQKFYEINEAYEIVIKTSKESSKEVRAGLNKKLGKTFGQGKVSSNCRNHIWSALAKPHLSSLRVPW